VAGSDLLLMLSRFEPRGLTQLRRCARLHSGRDEVGGLRDTIMMRRRAAPADVGDWRPGASASPACRGVRSRSARHRGGA
jgi:hypothetical protein